MKKSPLKPNQKKLALYFQIHQPMRLRRFKFFDIGMGAQYFDRELNNQIIIDQNESFRDPHCVEKRG